MDAELKQLLERIGAKLDAFEHRLAAVEKTAHVQQVADIAEITERVRREVMEGRRSPNSGRRKLFAAETRLNTGELRIC